MKYFSEITKKTYDTVEDLEVAEKAVAEKSNARAAAAAKVEAAYKKLVEARKEFEDVLTKFCKEYGTYHKSFTGKDLDWLSPRSWLDFWL